MEASTEKKSTIENSTENSFDEAMNNMVNSENAPPFMKKWLDQQPQFKNKDGKIVDLTSEESMKEFISQCEQAIKDLEEGLEKKTVPFYMRGISKKLLNTVKMEKEQAEKMLEEGFGKKSSESVMKETESKVSEKGSEAVSKTETVVKEGEEAAGKETTKKETKEKSEKSEKSEESSETKKDTTFENMEDVQKAVKEKMTKIFSGEDPV